MEAKLSVAESRLNHRTADDELSAFIDRRQRQRIAGEGAYDLDEQWKLLAEEARDDRRETLAVLWSRYHRRQAARLRKMLGQLVHYHEREAQKWEGR